jgi:TetR/AcrR family transcriptional repressor of nem operon
MRYASDHKQKSRLQIVETAGREFRLKGFDGIGVDGLMAAAALTSGAFYGHFRSKRAVIAEVVKAGLDRLKNGILCTQARDREGWLGAFTGFYLSDSHRRNIASGCALPSLSGDVVRADAATRAAYQAGLLDAARAMAAAPPFCDLPDGERRALAVLLTLAGGTLLARAVGEEEVGREIAAAAALAVAAVAAGAAPRPPVPPGAKDP